MIFQEIGVTSKTGAAAAEDTKVHINARNETHVMINPFKDNNRAKFLKIRLEIFL
jgi:hypothetical protein